MSSFGSPPLPPSLSGGPGGPGSSGRPRQRGRVTLRQGASGPSNVQDMLDPASRSLTDALGITFRLLQVGMVFLLGAFMLSGFQRVNESERGLRLVFGRITSSDLQPGFQAAMPEPMGELIRVGTGEQRIELKTEFFPKLTEQDEASIAEKSTDLLGSNAPNAIDPDADGQLLTADGNIVHGRVTLTYRRTSPARTVQAIMEDPESGQRSMEERIVRAAARRGVVQAAARMSIDEFLKSTPDLDRQGTFIPPEAIAKQLAQEVLDSLDCGIEIQSLSITKKIPPRYLINDFSLVATAQASAQKQIADAELARKEKLGDTAGQAADLILAQISRYERQLETEGAGAGESTLTTIHNLMMREPTEIDGKTVKADTFGKISNLLVDAQQYRTNAVTKSQNDASLFAAKRQEFASNPFVMVHNEWTSAMTAFFAQENVQTMLIPPGTSRIVLQINRDPTIAREQETKVAEAEAKAAADKRDAERRNSVFQGRLDGTSAQ